MKTRQRNSSRMCCRSSRKSNPSLKRSANVRPHIAAVPSIPGTEEVLFALGRWPSFHDAEVLHFSLYRRARPDEKPSEARLNVQVREHELV